MREPGTPGRSCHSRQRDEYAYLVVLCSFRHADAGSIDLLSFHIITFMSCTDYNHHLADFQWFLKHKILPCMTRNPDIHVINHPYLIDWNLDKAYLLDLEKAGFLVSKTKYLDRKQLDPTSVEKLVADFKGGSVVIKPSVSASGRLVHRILDPRILGQKDKLFLRKLLEEEEYIGHIMIQEYEPSIRCGEYSLVFIGGVFAHCFLKKPVKGEDRVNTAYGGTRVHLDPGDIPLNAMRVSLELMEWLATRVELSPRPFNNSKSASTKPAYARVDGVVRDDGQFVIVEVELIEPEMFLCGDPGPEDRIDPASISPGSDIGFKMLCEYMFPKDKNEAHTS